MYLFIFSLTLAFGATACLFAIGNEMVLPQQQVIILLGPPGAGKGTQAIRLSQELKLPHISTGDLFRENLSLGTELGKKAKSFMDQGQLVPDEIVLQMLFERTQKADAAAGYLLDGVPRTIPQAMAIDARLGKQAQLIVLNLDVADEVLMKRLAARTSSTGEKRSDDKPEVVRERLKVYHEQTKPLISYYSDKKVLETINGDQEPDKVFKDLLAAYKNRGQNAPKN